MDEIKILQEGMETVNKCCNLLEFYSDTDTSKPEYLLRLKLVTVMILRWLEKYETQLEIPLYGIRGKNIQVVKETVRKDEDILTLVGQQMNDMECVFIKLCPSWKYDCYTGVSRCAAACYDTAIDCLGESEDYEAAFVDGKYAFIQCFKYGPFKEEQSKYWDFLGDVYDLFSSLNECRYAEYLEVLRNTKILKYKKLLEKELFSEREQDLLQTAINDLVVDYDPFHSSELSEFFNVGQGIQRTEVVYHFMAMQADDMSMNSASYQYYPHRGLEMYLLERLMVYLERSYPEIREMVR